MAEQKYKRKVKLIRTNKELLIATKVTGLWGILILILGIFWWQFVLLGVIMFLIGFISWQLRIGYEYKEYFVKA